MLRHDPVNNIVPVVNIDLNVFIIQRVLSGVYLFVLSYSESIITGRKFIFNDYLDLPGCVSSY